MSYIEREAAFKLLRDTAAEGATPYHIGLLAAARAIEALPAADVRPVVKARWSEYEDELFGETIKAYCCSNCHHLISRKMIIRNFCPKCGAEMREES